MTVERLETYREQHAFVESALRLKLGVDDVYVGVGSNGMGGYLATVIARRGIDDILKVQMGGPTPWAAMCDLLEEVSRW